MKFNKIRLIGTTTVDLPIFSDMEPGPFVLKSATGLGPPERDVFRGKTTYEGSLRQGSRTADREIVILIALHPDWNVGQTSSDLRTTLYGMLTTKYDRPVYIHLMLDDTVVATAEGDISRFETSIFDKDPEVQITINCDYPYLKAPEEVEIVPTRTVVGDKTEFEVVNAGSGPSGFRANFILTQSHTGNLILSDDSAGETYMSVKGPWTGGDIFTVDTRPGQRGVWRTPSGSTTPVSLLSKLIGSSTWLTLYGGSNTLVLNSTTFDWGSPAFVHTPVYWGV